MLHDKVYLWLTILSCVALAVACTLGIVELIELQDPSIVSGASPF